MNSALVTGASRGIGLGIATRLAEQGRGLTITSRTQSTLDAVADQLRAAGSPHVLAVAGDMADPEHLAAAVKAHGEQFGTMDALVLNAGVGTAGTIAEYPMRRFEKSIAVNLRAPMVLMQEALPLLRAAAAANPGRGAKVIALASIAGVYAEAGLGVYGATKAALLSMIDALNAEESAGGVTGAALAPAYVDTDMAAWTHDTVPPETMIQVSDIVELVDALLRLSSRAVVPRLVVNRAGASAFQA
ncbi:SDR family NAD(P)-dependent oxidoreductase [Tomitella biformata]|uniref:SDR family NAD(P)-dependent oxidoreductase n=1 Tax=Tomitella biformata TaxID=630403 RepID=UPI0004658A16|nr:SDR family NAD(P)-dependent oxidoreductase [Tomitella biformata]